MCTKLSLVGLSVFHDNTTDVHAIDSDYSEMNIAIDPETNKSRLFSLQDWLKDETIGRIEPSNAAYVTGYDIRFVLASCDTDTDPSRW